MLRFRTLRQRFGALYALLALILAGVSIVVTLHMRSISLDSERLIEEAREQAATASLITEIDALEALLRQPSEIDASELDRARQLLKESLEELEELEGDEGDPSREEHQEAEERIAERLVEDLESAEELLTSWTPGGGDAEVLGLLEGARHYARVLLAEAREEAREANNDLQKRAATTRGILISTWGAALLLLGVAFGLVHRGVVRPLRVLRDGTERFGHGERAHRIRVGNDDEIGDLARSFNDMADKLTQTQDHLEERVRQRTREFLRAARLADLGILASGIAHEINTPLGSITSSAEGLQRRCQRGELDPELLKEYCTTIVEEAYRAREITTRMLALVRQEPSEVARVPLEVVVRQAETALRHRAERRNVRLVARDVPQGVFVLANAGELVQILVNLLSNAIDASPSKGRVEFQAGIDDGQLRLRVTDEGSGIAEEDLERVFEPFFTTKRPGDGTGLGLALVATMVESRGGRISVDSEVGRGTTFLVRMPTDWSREP